MPLRSLQDSWSATSLSSPQLIIGPSFTFLPSLSVSKQSDVWSDSLIFPAYFAAISAIAILVQLISNCKLVKQTFARFYPSKTSERENLAPENASPTILRGFWGDIFQQAISLGGLEIFIFRIIRFTLCLVLLGLTIISLVLEERDESTSWFTSLGKHWGKIPKHYHDDSLPLFTHHEWLHVAMCLTYAYASIIALIAVCARPKLAHLVNTHLVLVLFVVWGVYAYRDLYPLGTFVLSPTDTSEGWLMWTKIAMLSFTAVVIPSIVPTQYIPLDPKDPAAEPNPEQTASWISWLLYFYLDPLIIKASRSTHLPATEYPPLADYDWAKNLVKKNFPYLDPMSALVKSHLFFGLMKVFRREYTTLIMILVVRTLISFLNPVAVNRLLSYIENDGKDATARPWVWIVLLFFSPFLGSLTSQMYIFVTTRSLVRAQAIITQLVFEHALRIRMKAETSDDIRSEPSTALSTTAPSPDTASVVDQTASGGQDGEHTATSTTLTSDSNSQTGKASNVPSSLTAKDDKRSLSQDLPQKSADLVGKINNLVSTDIENIIDARDFLLIVVSAPMQIVFCVAFLYYVLGWSAVVGMVVMVALFPLPGYFAKMMQTVQGQKMKMTDARVQSVTETMNVIRMVKLFGWEGKMNDKLAEKREEELKMQRKRLLLELLNGSVNFLIPVVNMLVVFACFTLVMKQDLTASRVFSAMSVFDILRDQMFMIFGLIPQIIQGKVSLDRVSEFLWKTELLDSFSLGHKDSIIADNVETNHALIGIRNASFTWSNEAQTPVTPGSSRRSFTLRVDNELIFKRGKINLVVGPTGSGKTSLLMALLGELHFLPSGPDSWFNLPREGGVAYAAQESWVQNETIKDNILFGAPFDEVRYKKVIDQCALARDLALFSAGDNTEVGEKGLSLSGGQKARITLARAVYSSADILILDDVLAALDVHTSRWIIDKCFKGDLIGGRTVILVTHNVAVASPIADFVVTVGSNGRIVSQGTVPTALKANKNLTARVEKDEQKTRLSEETVDADVPDAPKQGSGKLIVAEEISEGHVSWVALKLLFESMGGSSPVGFWFLVVGSLGLVEISNVAQTWYLAYWAAQYDVESGVPVAVTWYLSIYAILLFLATVIYAVATWIFIFGSLRASRRLHSKLIESVMGTTLRWLDSTPVSRVIARCTRDMQAIDGPVIRCLEGLLGISLSMLMKFGAVVIYSPIFACPGIGVALLGAWCGQLYIKAQLCVKREMSNARSPVLGHFGAAIAGIVSIRAYQAQHAFRKESLERIDRYSRAARTFYNLNRWISLRIDTLGALFSASLAAYLVYRPGAGQKDGYAAETGFSLNMAVGFSGMILWWVRLLNEFEVSGNSLERIQDYVSIEQETKPTQNGVPPAYWPASGDIRVENLNASYTPGGAKVLHDLSFHIASGERVGVVGRTGSGKSSLTLSLLRCIPTEGTVYFDNLATDNINLDALRSNITIIPQIPELLSGSLRENLDPFGQYDDATLNDALRAAGLFSIQSETDEGRITLETSVSSGGGNLSVGQRQIFALARAIVRQSKLLILDEATSAIDYETDAVIQSSLRHGLGNDVTLFTIAHRLQTIMDADKIMVLDAGRIAEFGKPSELLQIEGGKLKALVDESGDKEALYQMAQVHVQD